MKNFMTSVILIALLFAVGCSKEQPANSLNINVEDNILIFKNTEHFQNVAEKMIEDQDFFKEQFKQLKFTSNYENFNILEEEDIENMATKENSLFSIQTIEGEDYVYQVIESPIFGNLVNNEGLIIIGDKAYKYTYENIYIANSSEVGLLRSDSYGEISNLKVQEIERTEMDILDLEVQPRINIAYCNHYFDNVSRNRARGVGKIQANGYGVYYDIAVTTANWRKSRYTGVWYKLKANALENSGYIEMRYKNAPIGNWNYTTEGAYNSSYGIQKKDIYLTIKAWYTGPPYIEILDAEVNHSVTDHSETVECNNFL